MGLFDSGGGGFSIPNPFQGGVAGQAGSTLSNIFKGVAGKPGSQGDGGQPMNVPNPAINSVNPYNQSNSPWSPTGTQPQLGPLADPLNRSPDGKTVYTNQLAPGLGETNSLNTAPLSQLQDMTSKSALASDSPWAQSQFNQIDRNTATLHDAAQQNMLSSVQGASDQAASHGGLTGGGSARIGAMGMMGAANADQGAGLYGAQAKDATRAQDYQAKVGMLEQLPGQELGAAQNAENVQGYNTGAVMTGDQMYNQGSLTKYGQDMNSYIGQNLSSAIGNSGKRGVLG